MSWYTSFVCSTVPRPMNVRSLLNAQSPFGSGREFSRAAKAAGTACKPSRGMSARHVFAATGAPPTVVLL